MKVYYDQDADLNCLKNKTVAIIGYGSQGHAHEKLGAVFLQHCGASVRCKAVQRPFCIQDAEVFRMVVLSGHSALAAICPSQCSHSAQATLSRVTQPGMSSRRILPNPRNSVSGGHSALSCQNCMVG